MAWRGESGPIRPRRARGGLGWSDVGWRGLLVAVSVVGAVICGERWLLQSGWVQVSWLAPPTPWRWGGHAIEGPVAGVATAALLVLLRTVWRMNGPVTLVLVLGSVMTLRPCLTGDARSAIAAAWHQQLLWLMPPEAGDWRPALSSDSRATFRQWIRPDRPTVQEMAAVARGPVPQSGQGWRGRVRVVAPAPVPGSASGSWRGPDGELEFERVMSSERLGVGMVGGGFMEVHNNPEARNPCWNELVCFLIQDRTDETTYDPEHYVCGNFARDLHDAAERAGWRCAVVLVEFPQVAHALNAFDTTDRGLVFIDTTGANFEASEPLEDCWVDLRKGGLYRPEFIIPHQGVGYRAMGVARDVRLCW